VPTIILSKNQTDVTVSSRLYEYDCYLKLSEKENRKCKNNSYYHHR
jgi:hypothetical protein